MEMNRTEKCLNIWRGKAIDDYIGVSFSSVDLDLIIVMIEWEAMVDEECLDFFIIKDFWKIPDDNAI
jgi:hypothetical protein